ncbi:transcriptional regulator, partial [Rhodococcus sp. ENV425]
VVRDHGHVHALEQAAMAGAATGGRPHRRKERIPPGPDALAAAEALRNNTTDSESTSITARSTVTDLAAYERAARGRNTLA